MWIDDDILKRCAEPCALSVWRPESAVVVLGASNDKDRETNVAFCDAHHIPILKRYGGGGTVVLYPGSAVVSVGTWVSRPYENGHYFKLCNAAVIDCLAQMSERFSELSQNGISDIVYGERKVAGTSLFRSRNYLLYQASILVELDLDLVQGCLAHPTKEPKYREGRAHKDFLCGLADIVAKATTQAVTQHLKENLGSQLGRHLASEFILPQQDHFKHLLTRAESAS